MFLSRNKDLFLLEKLETKIEKLFQYLIKLLSCIKLVFLRKYQQIVIFHSNDYHVQVLTLSNPIQQFLN